MDESQQIDRLIEVMEQLQLLVEELEKPAKKNTTMILGLMIAMIKSTPVPDIKILPGNTTHTTVGLA
tara:strand:- start:3874 stop:4074 length:201 start_codon:yes stop_codon:yes gene_type:complete